MKIGVVSMWTMCVPYYSRMIVTASLSFVYQVVHLSVCLSLGVARITRANQLA